MTAARQLSRDEILALPATMSLAQLAECLGVSEPVVRMARRSGELAALGIRVTRLGAQHRVVTSTVWTFLGISPAEEVSTESARPAAAGQRRPAASPLRAVRQGGAARPVAVTAPESPKTARPGANCNARPTR